MKKILSVLIIALALGFTTQAQRYAVIDSKYILDKMPEYGEAQTKLEQFSKLWQQEIDQNEGGQEFERAGFEHGSHFIDLAATSCLNIRPKFTLSRLLPGAL